MLCVRIFSIKIIAKKNTLSTIRFLPQNVTIKSIHYSGTNRGLKRTIKGSIDELTKLNS